MLGAPPATCSPRASRLGSELRRAALPPSATRDVCVVLTRLGGYPPAQGDVYFWGAQANPVDNASLLATFPLVHHLRGCLGLSLSLDGRRWSRPTPLLRCDAVGERALAHPAAPAIVRRGGALWLYVHESVPGASVDAFLPKEQYYAWADLEAHGRLARYALPVSVLERWTRRAKRSLLLHHQPTTVLR